jgi:hypothetical protein
MGASSDPTASRPSGGHRTRTLAIVAGVALVAVLVVLATVPVPQSATTEWGSEVTGTSSVQFNDRSSETLCPSGAHATVQFASTGVEDSSTVLSPNGSAVWQSDGPNWTAHFAVAQCGDYQFYSNGSGNGAYQYRLTLRYDLPLL